MISSNHIENIQPPKISRLVPSENVSKRIIVSTQDMHSSIKRASQRMTTQDIKKTSKKRNNIYGYSVYVGRVHRIPGMIILGAHFEIRYPGSAQVGYNCELCSQYPNKTKTYTNEYTDNCGCITEQIIASGVHPFLPQCISQSIERGAVFKLHKHIKEW